MAKNLRQRLGTGIVLAAAGLGSLVGIGGCETTPSQNMAISGTSAQYVATTSPNLTYKQSQTLGAMGGLLGVLAQQEAMKEAAREGKSEVNVNVYNNNPVKERLIETEGGGVMSVDENGNGIGWRVVPRINCIITDINGNSVMIGGLNYRAVINANPEKYKEGWRADCSDCGEDSAIYSANWKGKRGL